MSDPTTGRRPVETRGDGSHESAGRVRCTPPLPRGHPALTAASGPEALELLAGRRAPDIAVLDVSMPGMTGFELLRRLRAQKGYEAMPAIFLSARVQPDDVEQGRAAGAVYLTKPFVTTALLKAIDRVSQPSADW
jgi:CheY-like chemotaxis protein